MGGISSATVWWQYTSPQSLPNLEVWYNASTPTTFNKTSSISSGVEITSWQNAGTLTSHDWNSTGNHRPEWFSNQKNGLGMVRFNGQPSGSPTGEDGDTDEYLTINPVAYLTNSGAGLSGTTLALVFKTANTGAGTRILSTTDSNGYKWGVTGNTWTGGMAGGTFTIPGITADTQYHHVILNFDGTQTGNSNRLKVRLDAIGVPLTFSSNVNATTSGSASTFYGGTDSNGSSNYWEGDIGELMIWTRALSDGEMATVENYFTTKWAI